MQTLLFQLPFKTGALPRYRSFTKEITGPKAKRYRDLLQRYGLQNAKVWIHRIGETDYACVLHDADDDALEKLATFGSSENPFDQWFAKECLAAFDIPSFDEQPPQPQHLYSFS